MIDDCPATARQRLRFPLMQIRRNQIHHRTACKMTDVMPIRAAK